MEQTGIQIDVVAARHGVGLTQLFGTNGYGCYCRYWHFAGTAREWLARCAHEPERNQAEMLSALNGRDPEMQGMVAETREGEVVGWLKLAHADQLTKLYGQRLYKGLAALERNPDAIWTVGCLFVREDFRRRGVARALLKGATEAAASWGARALEAFPRSDTDVADAALMMGPLRLFADAGFEVVHDFRPYPILRLELHSGGAIT